MGQKQIHLMSGNKAADYLRQIQYGKNEDIFNAKSALEYHANTEQSEYQSSFITLSFHPFNVVCQEIA